MLKKQLSFGLIIFALLSLSCSMLSDITGAPPSASQPGQENNAPNAKSTDPADDEYLLFASFPVKVTDKTGTLKVIAAGAMKSVQHMDIIAVL